METAGYSCESYLSGEKHSVKILRAVSYTHLTLPTILLV